MNISDNVSKLRNYLEFRKYSENSIKSYCSNFTGFLVYFERNGITHPDRINSEMIIDFLKKINEPSTHSAYHSAIKIYYKKIAHIGIEKFKYIERPKRNKKLPIVLSQDEIQKMFSVCENLKHKTIFALLYACGLRVSELINLRWQNIDRSRMIINIIAGKGKKDRQVMLPKNIIPLLENYYREYKSKEFVFNGQNKSPQYSAKSVGEVVKQLANKAEINKRTYTHLIRHCTGTHLVENGTDINLIQKIFGHSSVKTTNIYTHISHNLISKINSPINNIDLYNNY